MARSAFDDPMAGARSSGGGGWKSLFWFMVGAAGLGFAGYVYLVPYHKLQQVVGSRQSEVAVERGTAEAAMAERERLKADLAKYTSAMKDKEETDAKRKTTVDALAGELKPGLEELGGTIVVDSGMVQLSFQAAKLIDKNGIDVSDGGMAALKILAGAAKKQGASIRIRARSSAAAPPKELRALFHTAGEMNAVRAARMMSALESSGLAPGKVGIVGQAAGPAPRATRSKKPAPAPPDRVELEVLPE